MPLINTVKSTTGVYVQRQISKHSDVILKHNMYPVNIHYVNVKCYKIKVNICIIYYIHLCIYRYMVNSGVARIIWNGGAGLSIN